MPLPIIAALGKIGLAAQGAQSLGSAATNAAKSIGGLPWKIESFADSLISGKEAMRQYSGAINHAFAKLEVGSAMIRSGQARATAGTTGPLIDSVLDLKRTLGPWQAIFTNGFNKLSTVVLTGLTNVLKAMEQLPYIGENIKKMREEMEKADQAPIQSVQFLNDIAAGRLSGRVTDRIQVPGMNRGGV